MKRDLLAKISAAVPSDSLIDAVRSPIIARKEAGRTARDPGKSDSESGRRIWVRLPRALAAGFVKQALQVTDHGPLCRDAGLDCRSQCHDDGGRYMSWLS